MNFFDIIIIVILAFCLIRGIYRGIVKELASIIGVVSGFYAAYTYYPLLTPHLTPWITVEAYQKITAFLIIFSVIFIMVGLLGLLIKFVLRITFMTWVDRLCGASFGAVKGILIAGVLFTALVAFLPADSKMMKTSLLSRHVATLSETMSIFVSKAMRQDLNSNIKRLKKEWHLQT